ncbi:MAG: hypothetical protein PWQ75_340 [Methanolobus sp.]|nr:hypothetical protein [Methanolobus sp.]MDK2830588.1 hypothetical protein [Methanolobus sp.]
MEHTIIFKAATFETQNIYTTCSHKLKQLRLHQAVKTDNCYLRIVRYEPRFRKRGIGMNDKDHYSGDDEAPDRITSIDELIEHIMEMFSDSITEEDGKTVIRGFTIIGQPGKKPTVFGFSGQHEYEDSDYEDDEREGDFYIFKQEPFIDIFETDEKLVVLADLGVEEKHVEYYPYCSHVEITVITKDTGYSRVVDLPCGVDPETMAASYKNGVLELTFELAADEE